MSETMPREPLAEAQTLAQLPLPILEEVIRQLRSTRNDIIRYGVWNIRNLSDDEFNKTDDRKLLGYFRQDLLETRFLSKGRRIDLIQLWNWFDAEMSGTEPLLVDGREVFLNIQDKDLEKVRKRIAEIQSFFPTLRGDDLEAFRRVKYKLRRTVMRLTYDLHHLFKRLEKYRKNIFMSSGAPRIDRDRIALEVVAEIPEPPMVEEHDDEP
ncbi:MAG: hypothetical protein JO197_07450 [Acidobacteria bacterium]|nr:hypothetical protein [Acidobacteriota bacterium]MBV9475776.1 hypothetical protein [Acidobacteriota bacterium]